MNAHKVHDVSYFLIVISAALSSSLSIPLILRDVLMFLIKSIKCLFAELSAATKSSNAWGWFFYCLGVFWGLLEGVSVLSKVSGSAFYSNLIYINCALIKSLTFSKRRGGPRCLKYQNVPTSRSFWPIGNPWERFQSWDIRVYFIPVPDDHTVYLQTTRTPQHPGCTHDTPLPQANTLVSQLARTYALQTFLSNFPDEKN